uniref:Reverse transcriptase domain-containing protein n=1 Tax=Tanacetum cinerariifolium TaxID=118510 RepID=A0A6L2M1Z1_TANCI|nr:reverse transcriptase domain-containing protein [Tanacetum cinerariifolium]
MADNRTMDELLQAPTEGYGEAIAISKINADHFGIKTNLLQLVQANPYHGFEKENPHTHINNYKRITSTLKFRDVPNDLIKLMMFSYSLEANARVWYDKEAPNSILTWEDLVNKFVNQFFPPSKTTHLKNEISRFTQRFEETFEEAWKQFKKMLKANILSKTTREALQIIENKSKVRYSRNKPNVSRMNTTSRDNASMSDDRIDKLADQISTLVDIFAKKIVTPAPVKAVEESCVTCGGNHASYYCPNTDSNQPSDFVAMVQTPGSGISILLAVGTPSTGSGNLYCQWELSPGSGNALCILFPTRYAVFERGLSRYGVLAVNVLLLKVDESIIYDVSTDVGVIPPTGSSQNKCPRA